jgi:hypothetical protein
MQNLAYSIVHTVNYSKFSSAELPPGWLAVSSTLRGSTITVFTCRSLCSLLAPYRSWFPHQLRHIPLSPTSASPKSLIVSLLNETSFFFCTTCKRHVAYRKAEARRLKLVVHATRLSLTGIRPRRDLTYNATDITSLPINKPGQRLKRAVSNMEYVSSTSMKALLSALYPY